MSLMCHLEMICNPSMIVHPLTMLRLGLMMWHVMMIENLLGGVVEPFLLMMSYPSLRKLHMRWDITPENDVTLEPT
jgi:hypothetical protein